MCRNAAKKAKTQLELKTRREVKKSQKCIFVSILVV